jgi:hypothetical protein
LTYALRKPENSSINVQTWLKHWFFIDETNTLPTTVCHLKRCLGDKRGDKRRARTAIRRAASDCLPCVLHFSESTFRKVDQVNQEIEKYTLGWLGGMEVTRDDVREWANDVFRYAGHVLNQQPDIFGMAVWSHLHFGARFIPDVVHEVDTRPLKKLVRLICAIYEPGCNYGPIPKHDELLLAGAEARETHWRLNQARKTAETLNAGRKITRKDIAEFLGILETSLVTKTWPQPSVKGKGRKPSEWVWSDLRPYIELQYPKENWRAF